MLLGAAVVRMNSQVSCKNTPWSQNWPVNFQTFAHVIGFYKVISAFVAVDCYRSCAACFLKCQLKGVSLFKVATSACNSWHVIWLKRFGIKHRSTLASGSFLSVLCLTDLLGLRCFTYNVFISNLSLKPYEVFGGGFESFCLLEERDFDLGSQSIFLIH